MRKQVAHRAPLFFSTVRQQTDSCRGQAAGPGRLEHARGHHRSSGIAAHDDRHHHLRDLHLAAASRPKESFVHLAGSDDIQRTTTALDEAGERLSRLFLTQIAFNAAFGVAIGIGLQLIGVRACRDDPAVRALHRRVHLGDISAHSRCRRGDRVGKCFCRRWSCSSSSSF
jgi:hypothetical protein